MKEVDLCIIGAGLVGLTLAASLKGTGLKVTILDAKNPVMKPQLPDTRTIALNHNTVKFLQKLQIWKPITSFACAIKQVHISERGTSAIAKLTATEAELDYLGYVTPIVHLYPYIYQMAKEVAKIMAPVSIQAIEPHTGIIQCENGISIKSKVIIAADGANSFVRKTLNFDTHHKDYKQSALVTSVTPQASHNHIAYERFLSNSTLALLPLTLNRYGVVWTASTADSQGRSELSDPALLIEIQNAFGYRAGRLTEIGSRNTYPLHQIVATEQYRDSVLLLGNAAHNLNPVAAQGFNLCIRDIQTLAKLIHSNGASPKIFEEYANTINPIHRKIMTITDSIATTFSSVNPLTKMTRRMAIKTMNRCHTAKAHFTQIMTGY